MISGLRRGDWESFMIHADDLSRYDVIVGYGIGQNYERFKSLPEAQIRFHYLADRRWEDSDIQEYNGIPIIRLQALKRLKNALIVLFPKSDAVRNGIMQELEETDIDICYIGDLFSMEYLVSGNDLIKRLPEREYCDEFHNIIQFDETVPSNIVIHFTGKNNLLKIGKNLSVNHLEIHFGNKGFCEIGNNTSIVQAACMVSDAELKIGEDCMLSCGIVIRTHDDHHIFDLLTHQRLNVPRDVIIEDQVWVGYDVMLLAGAHVGNGSVVGAGAVTSSSFGEHVLIAGCPAKAVRENVCWSRDNTAAFQRSRLEECLDRNALKYM